MSLINDITGAVGYRPQGTGQPTIGTGQQPGGPNAAQRLQSKFGNVVQTTFNSNMATVIERGAAGDFDDPTVNLELAAATERLRIAQQAAGSSSIATGTSPTGETATGIGDTTGANAAPVPGTSAGAGTSATTTAATGASQLQPAPGIATSEARQVYALRVKQSQARLENISTKLRAEYPQAAALQSASTGTWDPDLFVPKTRAEAEAFAQRMVIDATEAAARLDIVASMRDAARFEAAANGSDAAVALVTQLDSEFNRQKAYVDKLARIVDTSSDGAVSEAGSAALRGITKRDAGDMPAREMAAALRASGMDELSIKRVVGAGELAVDEEKSAGGSTKLREIAVAVSTFTWTHRDNLRAARAREERQIEQRRQDEDRRADDRRADRKSGERRQMHRSQDARAQEDRAEFRQWLSQLASEAQQRSAAS